MAKKNTATININGKRYDVVTGALLPVAKTEMPAPKLAPTIMDITPVSAASTGPVPVAKTMTKVMPKTLNIQRPSPSHTKAHVPQHAKTLVRSAVPKPTTSGKRQFKAQSHTGALAKVPSIVLTPKLSVQQVSPARLNHAKQVTRSTVIRKFAPLAAASLTASAKPASSLRPSVATQPVAPVAATKSDLLFERALARATAHEQPAYNPKKHAKQLRKDARQVHRANRPVRHRTTSLAAASLAVILLTGFIAWQNKANLTLRYADAKAGFSASLPGYRPSGFAYGKFSYKPGSVAVNFTNSLSGQSFSFQQSTSNWDSQTLLNNQVATQNHSYQTLQVAGRTIYLYGQNNASWVDKGILYQINSNGSLSTSDVLNIASSI